MDESMNEYTVKFDGKITVLPGKKKITLTSNGFKGFFYKERYSSVNSGS